MPVNYIIEDIAQAIALQNKQKNKPATAYQPITAQELASATIQARATVDLIAEVIMTQRWPRHLLNHEVADLELINGVIELEVMNFVNGCRNTNQRVLVDKLVGKISDLANKNLSRDKARAETPKETDAANAIHSRTIGRVQDLLCLAEASTTPSPPTAQSPLQQIQQQRAAAAGTRLQR